MKNLQGYLHYEVPDLLRSLFKTQLFRDIINDPERKYLKGVLTDVCNRPLITYEATEEFEKNHFTTWMGLLQLRKYDNDYINDLYLLHELAHWSSMEYGKCESIQDFHRKMAENELFSATLSEVWVYREVAGLREHTFDHPIWYDTVADDILKYCDSFEDVMQYRQDSIRTPDPTNFAEMQISKYASQNYKWSVIWSDNWQVVEQMVTQYLNRYNDALPSERDGSPSTQQLISALTAQRRIQDEYINVIKNLMRANSKPVPFMNEAVRFHNLITNAGKLLSNDVY